MAGGAPPRLRLLALPLAALTQAPGERVLGRRVAARFARRLSAAGVPAAVELASLEAGDARGWVVPDRAETDAELAEAGARRGAELVLGGAVGLDEAGTKAALTVRLVEVESARRVLERAVADVDGETWLQAARDVLTELFERFGVGRGGRAPLVERGVDLAGFVAQARAEDLDAGRALGHPAADEELLAAWSAAARASPASRDTRQMLIGLALDLGLASGAEPAVRTAARAALEEAAALDPQDPKPLLAAGEIALAQEDAAAAGALALRVLARDPGHGFAHALAGRAAAFLGQEEAARRHFLRHVLAAPAEERRRAELAVARWWLAAGRLETAHALFAELNGVEPLEVGGLLGLAESLLALDRRPESARAAGIVAVLAEEGTEEQRRARALLEFIATR